MRKVLLFVAIVLLSVLPFVSAVSYGYVDCDDYSYVFEHREVSGGLTAEGVKWAFTSLDEGIWMPLTWISYMIDDSVGGSPAIRHAHSILIHGLNAGLVFLVLLALAREIEKTGQTCFLNSIVPVLALGCALFWGVHPLRCESVVWIASRKDVLSLFWMLISVLLWLLDGKKTWWMSLGAFVLAAMAKPSVMTLPVLLLVLDVFVRRHVRWGRLCAYLPVAVATGVLAAVAQRAGGATVELAHVSFLWRVLNAIAACGIYLWHAVWPADLAVQCMVRYPDAPRFLMPSLLICTAVGIFLGVKCGAVVAIFRGRKWNVLSRGTIGLCDAPDGVTAGLLWFFVSVFPMLGIAGFGYHAFADRFTYIPSIGLSLVVLTTCLHLCSRRLMAAVTVLLFALAAAYGIRAAVQSRFWRDDITMWRHTLDVDGPRNTVAQRGVALWHFEHDHDLDASLHAFDSVFKYHPEHLEGCFDRYMMALCESGRMVEANALMPQLVTLNERVVLRENEKARARGVLQDVRETEWFILARATWFIAQGMYAAADTQLAKIAANEPNARPMLYLKGRLAEAQGDRAGRDSYWNRLLEHGTGDEIARYRFVAALMAHKGYVDETSGASSP